MPPDFVIAAARELDRAEAAELLRLAVTCGRIAVSDVVQWADEQIAKESVASTQLIALSLAGAGYPMDVARLLEPLARGANRPARVK